MAPRTPSDLGVVDFTQMKKIVSERAAKGAAAGRKRGKQAILKRPPKSTDIEAVSRQAKEICACSGQNYLPRAAWRRQQLQMLQVIRAPCGGGRARGGGAHAHREENFEGGHARHRPLGSVSDLAFSEKDPTPVTRTKRPRLSPPPFLLQIIFKDEKKLGKRQRFLKKQNYESHGFYGTRNT